MLYSVQYLDSMGSDYSVYHAAKISTGGIPEGQFPDDKEVRKMIAKLIKWGHTSPFEQASVMFVLEMPIYVMRQFVRHRTGHINERSLRYTKMDGELDYLKSEDIRWEDSNDSIKNDEKASYSIRQKICTVYNTALKNSVEAYKDLLDLGLHREMSRNVLNFTTQTKCIWSIDLRNLLRFFRLRLDSNAQYEFQILANEIFQKTYPHFPIVLDTFRSASENEKSKF